MIVSESFKQCVIEELELLLIEARDGKIPAIDAKVELPDSWWISFKVTGSKNMPVPSKPTLTAPRPLEHNEPTN